MAIFNSEDAMKIYNWLENVSKEQLIAECQGNPKTSKELSEELRGRLYKCVDNVLDSIQNETEDIIKNAADGIGTESAAELAEKAVKSEENMEIFRKLMLLFFLDKDIDYDAYEYLWKVAKEIF